MRKSYGDIDGPVGLAYAALAWVVVFFAFNLYWYLGGSLGSPGALPDPTPETIGGWVFEVLVTVSFPTGAWLCLAVARRWHEGWMRRVVVVLVWFGCVVLALRGLAGVVDDLARLAGVATGITGMSLEQTIGTAHPSVALLWSGYAIDAYFVAGALIFGLLAFRYRAAPRQRLNETISYP